MIRHLLVTFSCVLTLSVLTGCNQCYHDPLCRWNATEPAMATTSQVHGNTLANNDLVRGAEVLLVADPFKVIAWETSDYYGSYQITVEELGSYWLIGGYGGFTQPYLDWRELQLAEFGEELEVNLSLLPEGDESDDSGRASAAIPEEDECTCRGSVWEVSLICCDNTSGDTECVWEWGVCE